MMGVTLSVPVYASAFEVQTEGERRVRRRRSRVSGRIIMPPTTHRRRRRRRPSENSSRSELRDCLTFSRFDGPMATIYTFLVFGGKILVLLGGILIIIGFASGSHDDELDSQERTLRFMGPVLTSIGLCMWIAGCTVHRRGQQIAERPHSSTVDPHQTDNFDPNSAADVYVQLTGAFGFILFFLGIVFTAIGFTFDQHGDFGLEYMKFMGPAYILVGLMMHVISKICYNNWKKNHSTERESPDPPNNTAERNTVSGSDSEIESLDRIWSTNYNFANRGRRPEILKPPPYQQVAPLTTTESRYGYLAQEAPPTYSSSATASDSNPEHFPSEPTQRPTTSIQTLTPGGTNATIINPEPPPRYNSPTGNSRSNDQGLIRHPPEGSNSRTIHRDFEDAVNSPPPSYTSILDPVENIALPPPPSYETVVNISSDGANNGADGLPRVC